MRYAIASDIHGSATWCKALLNDIESRGADRLILLGDLMYHGPRNPLPDGYAPSEVAEMLNSLASSITAVRGNCDSEVDQMLLRFPCMSDYALVVDNGVQMLCHHGHLDMEGQIAALSEGSISLSGHTHVKMDEVIDGVRRINPGSVSIPKDGSHSYAIYDDGRFEFVTLQ